MTDTLARAHELGRSPVAETPRLAALADALDAGGDGDAEIRLALELVRLADVASVDEEWALLFLLLAVAAAMREGATRLDLDRLDERIAPLVAAALPDAAVAEVAARARDLLERPGLAALVGPPDARRPLVRTGRRLAPERLHRLEGRVASRLRARLAMPRDADDAAVEAALSELAAATSPRPSDEQCDAARRAQGAALFSVSGGPGTGKTTVVGLILSLAVRLGLAADEIALAAPTGQAAHRLKAALARGRIDALSALEPVTLHRLLGWSPVRRRFLRDARDPVAARLVIVDEASMIDLGLLDRLLDALRPETHLVLLGDARQLPAVESGAAFRDLVATGDADHVAELTRSFRIAADDASASLARAAAALRDGDVEAFLAAPSRPGRCTFRGAEVAGCDENAIATLFADWSARLPTVAATPETAAELALAHAARRVLCARRVGPLGVIDCNHRLRALHARRLGLVGATGFLPGEPVTVTANDYARGLFNGDLGVVVRLSDGSTAAAFARADGPVLHPLDVLERAIEPGWAVTVHRAQGSEADEVLVMLGDRDGPLLTREIVYTALTRARRAAVIAADEEVLAAAAARALLRDSGLAAALRDPA